MPRFYLSPQLWESATLDGEESHHLSQVMRVRSGETITLFDGIGNEAPALVLSSSKSQTHFRIGSKYTSAPPQPRITLAQSIPKTKNMDWIIQKSVELGVAAIQPLITHHTIVQPADNKIEKWQRTALEACKQCGQNYLPHILPPLRIEEWLPQHRPDELQLIASLRKGARSFRDILLNHPTLQSITVLIGPEGDFSENEESLAQQHGFLPITLGKLVLRVETASLLTLSAIRYQYL